MSFLSSLCLSDLYCESCCCIKSSYGRVSFSTLGDCGVNPRDNIPPVVNQNCSTFPTNDEDSRNDHSKRAQSIASQRDHTPHALAADHGFIPQDQGGSSCQACGVQRSSANVLGQDSTHGKVDGAPRPNYDRCGPEEEGDDPWLEQGVSQESRPSGLCEREPRDEDLRVRDHSSAPGYGHESHPTLGAQSELRRDGVWHACQQDLSPGGNRVSPVLGVVPEDLRGGTCQLANEEVHPVGCGLEQEECRRPEVHLQGLHEQLREGPHQGQGQGQEFCRSSYGQQNRFIFHHGSCGSCSRFRRGRDDHRGGLGSGSTGEPDSRTPSSTSLSHQEQGYQEGAGAQHLSGKTEASNFDFISPGVRFLGTKSLKQLHQEFCGFLSREWHELVQNNRLMLLEVCCSPESELVNQCKKKFGENSAERLSHWNGGDIETKQGVKLAKDIIREKRPRLVWLSPECGPYSPMQHLNCRTPEQKRNLEKKREGARNQYDGVEELAEFVDSLGLTFVIELSERCEAWSLPWFHRLQSKVSLHLGVCKGCQVNLRDEKGDLLQKGWKLASNSQEQVRHMTLHCTKDHSHGLCEGGKTCRRSAYYTPEFAKRVVNHLNFGETFEGLFGELIDGTNTMGWDSCLLVDTPKEKEDPELVEPSILVLSRQERSEIFAKLRRIHSATGHCNKEYLVKALQKRNVKPEVLELAKEFRCSVCDEKRRIQPRKQVTLTDIPPKWTRLQSDVGSWVHEGSGKCWKFILAIDEGSRLRVGMVLGEGSHRHPSGQEFVDFYNGYWRPCFGKPNSIRLDPDGAWRSGKLDQYFAEQQIVVEHVPTEAHWQISLIERAVQTTQNMMSALHKEFPEMSTEELFSRSLWAQNTHDQYLGFSPLQHAFGRNPDKQGNLHDDGFPDFPILTEKGVSSEFGNDIKAMYAAERAFLEEQADQRLKRATLSGSRKPREFCPGDLVFYWRKQVTKNHGASKFGSGKFLGPARVLATETRKEPDGSLRAGSIVWLYRAGRLIKAAPEQLRPASDREEAWNELCEDKPIPWTISGILESSERKTYDDISEEWAPGDTEDIDMDLEEAPINPDPPEPAMGPRRRHTFKHPLRKEGEGELPRRVRARQQFEEDHPMIALASEEPSTFLEEPGACLSVEIELPQGKESKKKHWVRDLEAYILNQVKKNHVEVYEKKLSPQEMELFKTAKSKEVKNFIAAKVFEKIPASMKPDRSQVLRMRWVLTWKIDPETSEKKAKARAVVLGYMDPEYEFRPTSSPTMTRSTRQLFLTMCAAYDFTVEKGDVSGAFLQGREYTRKLLCEPLPEICEALSMPHGSITRLTKAAYGLVEAPIEWYLTISSFLEELGFERQLSDPCCWGLFGKDDLPIGWICGHVDDFMFGGRAEDPQWKNVCKLIQEIQMDGLGERKIYSMRSLD